MAFPSVDLIHALRETATRLENGAHYAWGNHGSCNCGNLLQVATSCTGKDILRIAHTGIGEWTELSEEYCQSTDLPVNDLIGKLMELGLTPTDIHNIEYLEDRKVLQELPGGFRWLRRNVREDVVLYMRTFADQLESKLIAESNLEMVRRELKLPLEEQV